MYESATISKRHWAGQRRAGDVSDVWVMSEALLNKMMAPSGSGDVCLGPAHERHKRESGQRLHRRRLSPAPNLNRVICEAGGGCYVTILTRSLECEI